ncbi:MAG: alpha/beta hydrolase [Bacteroidota bacterium]
MQTYRKYGKEPHSIALIHGGPGAAGYMAPLAEKLSEGYGIIEPLQTKYTIEDQLEELKSVLLENGVSPFVLIGHSWGAWLSYVFAARHPYLIRKLILVASPPFEKKYSERIMDKRLSRLNKDDLYKYMELVNDIQNSDSFINSRAFAQIGNLMNKADAFDSNSTEMSYVDCNFNIFKHVWGEATQLRDSGELLTMAKQVQCPVVAVHGDYDSHPAEGVKIPLSDLVADFKFHLFEKCGHTPWIEKYASEKFYNILQDEL